MKSLSYYTSPVIREKVKDLYAEAAGVRWDVFFSRFAFGLTLVAGTGSVGTLLITLSCLAPGRKGMTVAAVGGSIAAVSGCASALLPKMTKVAGICHLAQDQKRPLWPTLQDIWAVFSDAPAIVRRFEAQREADAREAEQERQAQIAQESHTALVTDVAKEVAAIFERSKSFRLTAEGLVEDGILAGATAGAPAAEEPVVEEVVAPMMEKTVAPVIVQAVEAAAEKAADDAAGRAEGTAAKEAAQETPKQESIFPVVTIDADGTREVAS